MQRINTTTTVMVVILIMISHLTEERITIHKSCHEPILTSQHNLIQGRETEHKTDYKVLKSSGCYILL